MGRTQPQHVDSPGTTVTVSASSDFEIERAVDSILLGTAGIRLIDYPSLADMCIITHKIWAKWEAIFLDCLVT